MTREVLRGSWANIGRWLVSRIPVAGTTLTTCKRLNLSKVEARRNIRDKYIVRRSMLYFVHCTSKSPIENNALTPAIGHNLYVSSWKPINAMLRY